MPQLTTVQVNSEFKFKTLVQNRVYGEDLRSLQKQKIGATMWFPEDLEDTPFRPQLFLRALNLQIYISNRKK